MGVAAVTAIAGGYLFNTDPALPFLVTGATNVIAAGAVATLPEAQPGTDERFTLSAARTAIGRLASPSLRSFTLYVALAVLVVERPVQKGAPEGAESGASSEG